MGVPVTLWDASPTRAAIVGAALSGAMKEARSNGPGPNVAAGGQAVKDSRMLFVRGIAADLNETSLTESFSALGPVSQCFLVRERGQTIGHRGFGFVQYALAEDAERASAQMNGTSLGGRKLQVELANKRAPLEERKKRGREAAAGTPAVPGAGATSPVPPAASLPSPAPVVSKGANHAKAAAVEAVVETPATPAPTRKERQPAKPSTAQPLVAPSSGDMAAPGMKQRQVPAKPRAASSGGPPALPASAAEQKHRLARAVAIGNLMPGALTVAAIKLAEAAGKVEEVVSPAPEELVERYKLRADGCTNGVAVVIYETVKDAMHAVSQLHGAQAHLPQPQKTGRKGKGKAAQGGAADGPASGPGEAAGEGVPLWARQVSGEGAHVKKWRIILRNLPFTVTESQVRSALSAAGGFVWEIKIPRNPDGTVRGFAFAAFICRAHAERAIQMTNGKPIGKRMVAVDWAVAKAQFETVGKEAGATADQPAGGTRGNSEEEEEEEEEGEDGDDDDEDEDDGEDGTGDEEDVDPREVDGEEDEQAAVARERAMLHSVLDNVLAEEQAEAAKEAQVGQTGQAGNKVLPRAKPGSLAPAVKTGATTAAALSTANGASLLGNDVKPAAFGSAKQPPVPVTAAGKGAAAAPAKSAAAVAAPVATTAVEAAATAPAGASTGRESSGAAASAGPSSRSLACTVFVRGLPLDVNPLDLQLRMENYGPVKACRLVTNKAANKPKGTAFIEYKTEEGAQKAAAACARGRRGEGPGVVLAGGTIDVDLAVSQDQARDLSVAQFGGAPAAAGGGAQRGDKGSTTDRRNLYLAKEGEILDSSAAWAAMSEHDRQKRQRAASEKATKLRSPNFAVSSVRLSVRNLPPSLDEKALAALFVKAVKERATKERPQVKQAKILRDDTRVSEDGRPRSKGMGFVEFASAEHALVALRQLNNNPTVFTADKRPIVEFALENSKAVKAREGRQAQQAAAAAERAAAGNGSERAAAPDAKRLAKKRGRGDEDQGDDATAATAAPDAKRKRGDKKANGAEAGQDGGGAAARPKVCIFWDGTPGSCKRGDACIFAASHQRGRPTAAFLAAAAGGGGGGRDADAAAAGAASGAAAAAAATMAGGSRGDRTRSKRGGGAAAREASTSGRQAPQAAGDGDRRRGIRDKAAGAGGAGREAAVAGAGGKQQQRAARVAVISEVGRQAGDRPNVKRQQQRMNRLLTRQKAPRGGVDDGGGGTDRGEPAGVVRGVGRKQLLSRNEQPRADDGQDGRRDGQRGRVTQQVQTGDGGRAQPRAAPHRPLRGASEATAQQRKRQADEAVDRLVGDVSEGKPNASKRRKRAETDKSDQLAQQYLARLVGAAAKGGSRHNSEQAGAGTGRGGDAPLALKKWFE